jgi:hypothetical protein
MMPVKIIRFALAGLFAATSLAAETAPFLRRTSQTNGTEQLETCIRHYRPAEGKGPDIYLAGVAHLGDTNYFAALQKHLDAQSLVMFEGVGAAEAASKGMAYSRTNRIKAAVAGKEVDPSGLQTKLATSLGLMFQLDALNYDRPHFRNNDISLSKLRERLNGQDFDGDQFVKMLDGENGMFGALLGMLSTDSTSRALVRTILVEVLADAGNDIDSLAGLDPNLGKLMHVLLTERNEAIMANLTAELSKPTTATSISMIYGAAHMKELSRRLEGELLYRMVGEQWLPAFSVNPKDAGVSAEMLGMIRGVVGMMKQLRPSMKPSTPPAGPALTNAPAT